MTAGELKKIRVVDSHTGGEPTRVVIDGGPDLGTGDMAARLARLRATSTRFVRRSSASRVDPMRSSARCWPSRSIRAAPAA